jgi:hypothetical protein
MSRGGREGEEGDDAKVAMGAPPFFDKLSSDGLMSDETTASATPSPSLSRHDIVTRTWNLLFPANDNSLLWNDEEGMGVGFMHTSRGCIQF